MLQVPLFLRVPSPRVQHLHHTTHKMEHFLFNFKRARRQREHVNMLQTQ